MPDVFTRKKRSAVMAAIRAKNTKPEVVVRRMLHLMGCRFRLHSAALPGRPDIVIPKIQTVVQVKGCFWHGHSCLKGRIPVGNRAYWGPKIAGNRQRDRRNERKLRAIGWTVHTIWECDIRQSSAEVLLVRLQRLLQIQKPAVTPPTKIRALDLALSGIRNRR